jgi:hypothetical protein
MTPSSHSLESPAIPARFRHSQVLVSYGRPGEPDTLTTVDEDGRRTMTFRTTWQMVLGGALIQSAAFDEYYPSGRRIEVKATLDNYVVTSVADPSPGLTVPSAGVCATTWTLPSSVGRYIISTGLTPSGFSFSVCGSSTLGGPTKKAECAKLGATMVAADWAMGHDLGIIDGPICDTNDKLHYSASTCNADTQEYDYAVTIDSTAHSSYTSAGCKAQ